MSRTSSSTFNVDEIMPVSRIPGAEENNRTEHFTKKHIRMFKQFLTSSHCSQLTLAPRCQVFHVVFTRPEHQRTHVTDDIWKAGGDCSLQHCYSHSLLVNVVLVRGEAGFSLEQLRRVFTVTQLGQLHLKYEHIRMS